MFASFCSIALFVALPSVYAADVPTPPYTVSLDNSRDYVVLDANGNPLTDEQFLQTFVNDDVATYYQRRRGARKAVAVSLFVGAGVTFTGGLLLSVGNYEAGWAVIGTTLGGGMLTGGLVLLSVPQENRMDHWINEVTLRERVAAANPVVPASPDPLVSGSQVEAAPPARIVVDRSSVWQVSRNGKKVRSQGGVNIPVASVADVLGRPEVARSAAFARQSSLVTGGLLFLGGSGIVVMGGIKAETAYDSRLQNGGVASALTGVALMASSVVVLARSSRFETAGHWFSEEEIQQAVDLHNAGPHALWVEPERTPMLSVQPQIGLGYLGLTGTF